MHRITDTGRTHLTREHTFTSYNFGNFQVTLSNKRLIINNKQSSESIQLRQIRGVTIVDDYEQYSLKKAQYTRKIRSWYQCAGTLAGGITGYFCAGPFVFTGIAIGATAGLAMSSFLPITANSVATPSLLLVITEHAIKEYSFHQHSGSNIASLATFLLQVEEALYG